MGDRFLKEIGPAPANALVPIASAISECTPSAADHALALVGLGCAVVVAAMSIFNHG